MYQIMKNMDSTLYLKGDTEAAVKFFTLEQLIKHYRCVCTHAYIHTLYVAFVFVY